MTSEPQPKLYKCAVQMQSGEIHRLDLTHSQTLRLKEAFSQGANPQWQRDTTFFWETADCEYRLSGRAMAYIIIPKVSG